METENNYIPQERSLTEIEAEMEAKGFRFRGTESLTKFQFTKEAKFETVEYRTEDEIRKELIQEAKEQGVDIEVELIPETGLTQNQKSVLVFWKRKES